MPGTRMLAYDVRESGGFLPQHIDPRSPSRVKLSRVIRLILGLLSESKDGVRHLNLMETMARGVGLGQGARVRLGFISNTGSIPSGSTMTTDPQSQRYPSTRFLQFEVAWKSVRSTTVRASGSAR